MEYKLMKYVHDYVYKNYTVYNSVIYIPSTDNIEHIFGISLKQFRDIMQFKYLFFYDEENFNIVSVNYDKDTHKSKLVKELQGNKSSYQYDSITNWHYEICDHYFESLVRKFTDDVWYSL